MDSIAKLVGYIFLFFLAVGFIGKYVEENKTDGTTTTSQLTPQSASQPTKTPEPVPVMFLSEEQYVATQDAAVFHFNVNEDTQIKLVAALENQVPVDIITSSGTISKYDYVAAATLKEFADVISFFSQDVAKNNPDFFSNAMSKQGAYRAFESPWVMVGPGQYTVIVDNTEAFTPTRGDTPVNLRLYYLPRS